MNSSTSKILDSHIHLLDFGENNIIDYFENSHFFLFENSSSQENWSVLNDVFCNNSNFFPFFGVHPWYIEKLSSNWLIELEKYLLNQKSGIGEIGLHKSKKHLDIKKQIEIFIPQFELAIKLDRVVSIHCFKSWQELFEIFNQYRNRLPKFMIHSFNSSVEILEQIIKYGGYISLSPNFLHSSNEKNIKLIKKLPMDRLLIESDFPYIKKFKTGKYSLENNLKTFNMYREAMLKLYSYCSDILGIDVNELMEKIYENGKIFTNR